MHDTAPGASLRDALRDIWQEQLGLESPPRDDDRFFDLGGTSLGLVELVITIERRLGAILPLSTILEAPTLAELADLIGAGRRPERTREICVERERFTVRLLPIQPRGERAPLLFVAPAGGSVLPYYALADALPRDRPFWGLQIDLPRRSLRRPFGIPELADAFAEGIETLSPTSPVTLGGWSFGALVAWEIAARMSAGGRPVERVIALDCHALRYGPSAGRERLGDLIVNIARMIRESRPLVRDALYLRLVAQDKERSAGSAEGKRTRRSVLRALVARAARNAEVAELLDKDPRLAELQTDGLSIIGSLRHYLVAARRYDPPHLAVPVDVLKAEGSSQADARLGWEHISDGRVDAHLVPGDHYNLLTRPHVKGVAAVMALVLGEET